MAVWRRFFLQVLRDVTRTSDGHRKGCRKFLSNWWRPVAPLALLAMIPLLAGVPVWAQNGQELTGANVSPLEGPGAGTDTVLIYASGLTAGVNLTPDADWITLLSTQIQNQNGPNRLQFQFTANSGATRVGHIALLPLDGSRELTITVTQAGAGSMPAGLVSLTTSITGPEGIDVDSQGNLYIVDVSGSNLWEWTSATQQLSAITSGRAQGTFVDVAVDTAGDVFALENTPDGNLGTQVEEIRGIALPILPANHIVFSSEANQYEFPSGFCVDSLGQNLDVTTVDVSNKCLIDQFGKVYELDTVDSIENLGSFASAPTNAQYKNPPNGQTFFPVGPTYTDPCGNQMPGVSGSLYGLSKDGSGFIYFVDENGTRLNRYDPSLPWSNCTPPPANGVSYAPVSYGSFTTVAQLIYPIYYTAADVMGNLYLSDMPFSQIQELPRAYVSSAGPFKEPVGGGTETIQILPATQSLTGVFAPVSSDTTWLNVTSAANGVVTFSVAANSGRGRTATITVLGVPIQVTQAESQTPSVMTIVSGNNQQGSIGNPFATNLLVKVTNQWGDAVANVPVQFLTPSQQISTSTDARGYAATTGINAYKLGPISVTASIPGTSISQTFALTGIQVGINVNVPPGVSFNLNGANYTGAQFIPLGPGQYTLSTTSTQTPATGEQVLFNSWSDGGALSHTVTVGATGLSISGAFTTQYLLTATAGTGGFISPVTGYYAWGTVVNLTAFLTSPTYEFTGWSGPVASASAAQTTVTITQPTTVAANYLLLPSGCVAIPPNMTAWWKGQNNPYDEYGMYNGTAGGDLAFRAGMVNLAFYFDGTQSPFVSIPAAVFPPNSNNSGYAPFSFETWFQTSGGNGGVILGQQSGAPYGSNVPAWLPAIYVGTDGHLYAEMFYNGTTNPLASSVPVNDNYWHHVAVTYDGSAETLYLDGVSVGQSPTYQQVSNGSSPSYQLGTGYTQGYPATNSGWYTFNGLIDEATVYSRALTAVEVQNIALARSYGKCDPASALEGSGSGVYVNVPAGVAFTLNGTNYTGAQFVALSPGQYTLSAISPQTVAAGSQQLLFSSWSDGGSSSHTVTVGSSAVYITGSFSTQYLLTATAGSAGVISPVTGFYSPGTVVNLTATPNPGSVFHNWTGPVASADSATTTVTVNQATTVYANFWLPQSTCVAAPANLTAWWRGESTANDEFGLYNASLGGDVSFAPGLVGEAFSFDGTQSPFVSIPNTVFPPHPGNYGYLPFTFETWFQTSGGNGGVILGQQTGVPYQSNLATPGETAPNWVPAVYVGTDGNLYVEMFYNGGGPNPLVGTVPVNDNQWHHVAVTYDGNQTEIVYLDGATVAQSQSYQWLYNGYPLSYQLGTGYTQNYPKGNNGWYTFTGLIDEATVYSRALTAAEVLSIAEATNHGKCDPASTLEGSGSGIYVNVPPAVSFTLNGTNYTGPQFVSLSPGQYTLSSISPQLSTTGDQEFVFSSWSDGGAYSHTVTVSSSAVYITGSFNTQYQLTPNVGNGGSVRVGSGAAVQYTVKSWQNPGAVVNLTAIPNPGYVFRNWTGPVASSSSATTTVTMSQGVTVTANFWPVPSSCAAAPANVTAWWKGDGSTNDETTSYNATLGGDVSFASGLVGQAFSFDGTQSPFVALPAGAFPAQPGNGPFSFETWFQTSGGNGGVILGQQDVAPYTTPTVGWSPAIYVGTDGNLYVEMFYNGTLTQLVGSVPVNDNQWHHVAVTYDGSSEIAYLDGANIGQSLSFTQVPNGSPLSYQLGTGYTQNWPATNSGWYTFNGLIDEPTVYSRALTAAEVLRVVQAGSYGKCDPVAALNPGTLNFASLADGQTATQTTVVSNPGNAPLAISAIAADTGDTTYTVLSGNAQDCAVGTPVKPNASCNLRVQFSPQTTGAITGQISISDNSVVGQGVQVISLVGSGQSSPPTVSFTGPTSAVYGSTFTPVVSTNAGVAATIIAAGPCQVSGSVVTMTGATGQCQLQASWPANPPFTAATATLQVNAAPVIVTATVTVANKTFDGTTAATVNTCSLTNVLPADAGNVGCSATSATFASAGVDNNIPVTVNGITLGGSAAANYQLSSTTASTTANIVFGSADSACIVPPAGITAWWKADGDATDATGTFGATLGGDVSFAPGKVGQAFSFDGTQSPYVSLPAGAFPSEPSNGPFTFETWFQTTGANGGVILGEQSGVPYGSNSAGWTPAIYVGTDGKLYVEMFYNGATNPVVSPLPVNDSAWHHVAVTYDGTNEVVYLDAGAIGTISPLVQAPNGSSLSYQLGTGLTSNWPNGNGGWYTFNGLIDEATVYSRALGAGEIASIVQAANYGKCNPGASVSPGTVTFSNTPVGQTSTLTAVVSNPGNAPLTISSIAIDAGDVNFSVLSGNSADCSVGTPVQASASCNIRIQFAPQSTGSPVGSVTVRENSLANGGVLTVTLAGSALTSQSISFAGIATQTVGTPLALKASATSGLAVSFASTTPGVCSVTGVTATFLNYGSCTIVATQGGNGNYQAANPVSQTFVVMAPQTITFPGIAAQALGTPLTLTATASSGLPVTYTSSTTGVCTVSGSNVTFAANGKCTILASQAGNANYLAAVSVSQSFTVGKEPQSITWAPIPAQSVQQTLTLTATASSSLPITYTASPASVCTVSGSTASMVGAGTCTIKATQAGNSTYSSQSVSQSFLVSKIAQTITFGAIGGQTPGTSLALTATVNSPLTVSYSASPSSVCTLSGTTVSFLTAGTCKVTATQSGNSTYAAAAPVSQSILISKVAQTITFSPIGNQNVGGTVTLTATASSNLPITYTASPASVCTVSGSTASMVGAGTCTIKATQAGNATYNSQSVSQSFLVSKLSQTIAFNPIGNQNVGGAVTLTATASSSLPITFTASPASVCTVSGSTASMVGAGTCTIKATQAGNSTYSSQSVSQSFLVSKIAQTITFGAIGGQTPGTSLALTATVNSPLTVSYSASPSSVCTLSGTTVSFLTAGTCKVTATQSGNSTYAAAAPVSQSILISKIAQTITFSPIGNQNVGGTVTLTATASSNLPITYTASPTSVCTVSSSTASMVGAGTCTIKATQAGNATYNSQSVSQSFLVSKLAKTIAFRASRTVNTSLALTAIVKPR